ncbi:CYTH and CHAD domain-containing protein [Rivibacter subsaxonicus]|uniref:Inorganic triphosphatase YgiF n=1 Tax=Rivibacter subsaxonicus TaxID=457575 RepID=A0A4Q7V7J7_9BURK|nr:CYTH and CHAD domain-containing protein [Rivibacter subsaxonicus]RZT91283.1 inorganic triphosphatase YgiF [Rivibacter subsaxonicus]
MTETELRLHVPPAALQGVQRALAAAAGGRLPAALPLRAIYFDTPARDLAEAGIALRLRQEGRRWVQTLKVGAAHALSRAEHNVAVAVAAGAEPVLDAARHVGTPAGEALAALLLKLDSPQLVPQYRTDIRRRLLVKRARYGTVELALDEGLLLAPAVEGRDAAVAPVCELEIELKSGQPRAVIDTAARWIGEHGLWLDSRSKAERGDRLARGIERVPAFKAPQLRAGRDATPGDLYAAVFEQGLAQVLRNASELAAGLGAPEHVHQLRVALRRLRSARRLFDGWPGVPATAAWGEGAATLFGALGALRDVDVLGSGWGSRIAVELEAAGLPPLALHGATEAGSHDASALLAAREAALTLLALVAHGACEIPAVAPTEGPAATVDAPPAAPTPSAGALAAARLAQWHAQVVKGARRFDRIDDEARHVLRKRVKRLRYAAEFCAPLFRRKALAAFLEPMAEAQERLGEFNDLCVAIEATRALGAEQPQALYARGWLVAQRPALIASADKALRRLAKAPVFWD